jgi:hypothetical protein
VAIASRRALVPVLTVEVQTFRMSRRSLQCLRKLGPFGRAHAMLTGVHHQLGLDPGVETGGRFRRRAAGSV